MSRLLITLLAFIGVNFYAVSAGRSLESLFLTPPEEAKPIMIWQWMDGVVSKDGITADLEAYKEAGIGGVQQFLVGGPMQTLISDSANAVGTDNWRELMRYAIDECARLGLSFGTHNCPGWSSSAFPTVRPEDSMQKLVWSLTTVEGKKEQRKPVARKVNLRRPEVDPEWNYYRDIAVVVIPDDAEYAPDKAFVITDGLNPDGTFEWKFPVGKWRVYRFGHTTNGKKNSATAPIGGVGLECDKMSREALEKYWAGYPAMLLDLAGEHAGKTFTRFEIDSYEAGGQTWTPLMIQEFKDKAGYDLHPWLPALAGVPAANKEEGKKFIADWENCIKALFAENYYGYMSKLIHRVPGMKLLAQPYGTGGAKPFNPIHTEKVVEALAYDDIVCTEFWVRPNWGWKDIPRVTSAAQAQDRQIIFAEGFTCWPLHAWKDDPASLKAVADRSFCVGVNSLMLHAGAQNPWVGHLPGMTFGKWGTQWTPGQTWWISGGAKELFTYMSRCQALLQWGDYADDFYNGISLTSDYADLQWIHRRRGSTDIYFISNPLDSAVTAMVNIPSDGRRPEIWHPDNASIDDAPQWVADDSLVKLRIPMAENDAMFIILSQYDSLPGPGYDRENNLAESRSLPLDGKWTLSFPDGWGAPSSVLLDSLVAWNEHPDAGVHYFSGTARYSKVLKIKKIDDSKSYLLHLGDVKNLARVYLNGSEVAHLWKKPFVADLTPYLRRGDNSLEIEVTNLWVNRMVGDEQYPDDIEWDEPFIYEYAPGSPAVGSFMKAVPEWLKNKETRPVRERKTVVSFKYFQKDSPLLPSGLIGPVTLRVVDKR